MASDSRPFSPLMPTDWLVGKPCALCREPMLAGERPTLLAARMTDDPNIAEAEPAHWTCNVLLRALRGGEDAGAVDAAIVRRGLDMAYRPLTEREHARLTPAGVVGQATCNTKLASGNRCAATPLRASPYCAEHTVDAMRLAEKERDAERAAVARWLMEYAGKLAVRDMALIVENAARSIMCGEHR